jgi:RHS repeat-associated protein
VGNLLSKTDRKGNTIQYLYDSLYRLTQKTYPDTTTVEYAYDLANKVLQVSDPTGTYGFAYDNMGRLVGTSTSYAFLSGPTFTNSYTYDAASNRTSLTAPDGSISTYGYDTLNRLNGLANSWAGSFGFSYDALSRRTQLTRPNGVNTNYSYDSVSHLLSLLHQAGNTVLDGASYTYDPAGNRTAKTNYLNGVTSNYGYDPLYELTQVTQGGSTTETYSYDAVGNRLSSAGVPNYSYNSSNELTSNSSGGYTYDANGNTLSDPSGKSYSWDFENRLTQAVVPGTGTVNFKYDPFGKRIYKQSPTATSIFVYDGPNLIETTNGSGGEVASYTQTRTTDETLAELRGSTSDYYEADGLGSITSLSSATGAVANTYTYDSFGNTTASTGTLRNYFQYTGREFDPETGIYEYRARYYDPSFGRFLSEDPLGFQIAPNFYPYVANDPMGHIDPSGLCPCNSHKVKLYYTPNYGGSGYPDYHWYRQDSNGGWSSKHGWAPVGPQVNPGNDAAASGYGVFCANMCAPNQNGTAPVYNPVPWNDPKHIHTNNCYSYACDRLHPPGPDTKPQPGGHNPPANFGCIDIINAAQSDGLTLDYDVPRP